VTTYTVEFVVPEDAALKQAGETLVVEVEETAYLLAAARQAGLWLPADCQQGWCTTCAVKLLSGDVDHEHARRYFDVDAEADFVLTCTARPRSDCRVEVCAYEEILAHRAAHDLPPGRALR
jgi:ferredoxin